MNPYLIPGLEATPYAPLCPYIHKDHDRFYVAVDNTDREFGRFQNMMSSREWLIESGRLVVVTGNEGCGKTSLINRCAAWLRDELAKGQLMGEILTLTDAGMPAQSIMVRMEEVLRDLVDKLRDEQRGVPSTHITALENMIREIADIPNTNDRQARHAAGVNRVYRYLHDALPDNRIAIILLPSSELIEEIKSYADFARHPRIVFFAEADHVEDVDRMWPTTRTNDRMPPILLKVGPLNPGDGWAYVETRQESGSVHAIFPTVSEKTMQRVTSTGVITIGWLHKLLHGVYAELVSQNRPRDPLPSGEVSYEHIAGYHLRRALSVPGSMS